MRLGHCCSRGLSSQCTEFSVQSTVYRDKIQSLKISGQKRHKDCYSNRATVCTMVWVLRSYYFLTCSNLSLCSPNWP
uniref:Uncharacterized protein n=1 Tax=Anguilla anguilla TaxID=7936 RepID=A0A0E9TQS1_ANGAN